MAVKPYLQIKRMDIQWRVYGDGISSVDIYYSVSSDSNLNASAEGYWTGINGGIIAQNVSTVSGLNSYEWDLTGFPESDSVRIRIVSDEKVVLKELQREPMKGKLLHADFMRVSRKTMLKVTIPFNFLNEEDCIGVKTEGGVVTKTMRDIEILCSAENIPEIIEVDIAELALGDSIRLTNLSLPEGSEIPGLTEETDQMVVSVNAPKAVVEEEPLEDDTVEGDEDGDEVTDGASDEGSEESEEKEEAAE